MLSSFPRYSPFPCYHHPPRPLLLRGWCIPAPQPPQAHAPLRVQWVCDGVALRAQRALRGQGLWRNGVQLGVQQLQLREHYGAIPRDNGVHLMRGVEGMDGEAIVLHCARVCVCVRVCVCAGMLVSELAKKNAPPVLPLPTHAGTC